MKNGATMPKILFSITLSLLTLFTSLSGVIIETPHFKDIIDHVTEDTLVILDIDDTLLITKQMLGCDEWFMHRMKEHQANGLKSSNALEKALAEWEAIRHLTEMEIVEPGTEAIVAGLQKSGYQVMGLTTQGLALATRTVQQLNLQEIDLSKTAPSDSDHYIMNGKHGVLYRKGILFTSGTAKGEALFKLCDAIGYIPSRIVFINDKATHLADIEKTAKQRNVEFIGLRYSFSDARKAAYRPDIAEIQFNHSSFAYILSDEEALIYLNQDL